MVSVLLSVTFSCGLLIAAAHVLNRRFVAPVYDVAANLVAFGCAVAASLILGHWVPASLSAIAMLCWLVLARRTLVVHRAGDGQWPNPAVTKRSATSISVRRSVRGCPTSCSAWSRR